MCCFWNLHYWVTSELQLLMAVGDRGAAMHQMMRNCCRWWTIWRSVWPVMWHVCYILLIAYLCESIVWIYFLSSAKHDIVQIMKSLFICFFVLLRNHQARRRRYTAPHICSTSFALSFYLICTLFRKLIVGKFWRSNSTSSLCRKLSLQMWVGEFQLFVHFLLSVLGATFLC